MRLDRRLVGWGVMFILIGAIPLAVQSGGLDGDLVGHWPEVWPLLIVAVGLSLVLHRTRAEWLGGFGVAAVVGIMGGGLLATGLGDVPRLSGCGGSTAQPFAAQNGVVQPGGHVNVEFDCGTLHVGTMAGTGWTLAGNDAAPPRVDTTGNAVRIRSADQRDPFARRGNVSWQLGLPADTTLGLAVTINAGQGDLQLGAARLTSLDATLNAGSLTATLGPDAVGNAVNVTVNAGKATIATAAGSGAFNLSMNAGSLEICVPQGSAVRVTWSGALASHDLDSVGLTKVDDHTWTSSGFDPSAAHLELDVSANAGSFQLHVGGGCGA